MSSYDANSYSTESYSVDAWDIFGAIVEVWRKTRRLRLNVAIGASFILRTGA